MTHPVAQFSNPIFVAIELMKLGHEEPFANGARFHLMGENGERTLVRHSAEALCEARNTILSMRGMSGGEQIAEANLQAGGKASVAETQRA